MPFLPMPQTEPWLADLRWRFDVLRKAELLDPKVELQVDKAEVYVGSRFDLALLPATKPGQDMEMTFGQPQPLNKKGWRPVAGFMEDAARAFCERFAETDHSLLLYFLRPDAPQNRGRIQEFPHVLHLGEPLLFAPVAVGLHEALVSTVRGSARTPKVGLVQWLMGLAFPLAPSSYGTLLTASFGETSLLFCPYEVPKS